MLPSPTDAAFVRTAVLAALARLGLGAKAPLGETASIEKGQLVGRSFYFGAFRAVWRSADNRLEVRRLDGRPILRVPLTRG